MSNKVLKPQSFEYKGKVFQPYLCDKWENLAKKVWGGVNKDDKTLQRLSEINDGYNHKEFYKVASKFGAGKFDVFLVDNEAVIPCSFAFRYYGVPKWYERMQIVFNIDLNPFTKSVKIRAVIEGNQFLIDLSYQDLDEWNSFKCGQRVFDIHFDYDEGFNISIYPVVESVADYTQSLPVNVKFQENLLLKNC